MDPSQARDLLDQERTRLSGVRSELDSVHDESERESLNELTVSDQHQGDVGTETFNREADLSLLEQVEAELTDIEIALRRLDEGTYGSCEACGQPIGDERLEALPATRFCIEHQAAAERDAHIASRGTDHDASRG